MPINRGYITSGLIALAGTIIVLFPIFSSGPIFTLDSISSPIQNTNLLLFIINSVVWQKIFLFLTVFTGVAGCVVFVNSLPIPAKIGVATAVLTSPFYIERIAIGQWHILTAMGLISWIIVLIKQGEKRKSKAIYYTIAIVSLLTLYWYKRSLSFFLVMFWALLVAWVVSQKENRFKKFLLAIVIFLVSTQITRLAIMLIAGERVEAIDSQQLPLFEVGQGPLSLRIIQIISHIGFWAERALRLPYNLAANWVWYIPGMIWFGLGIVGLWQLCKKNLFMGTFFIALYLISFIIVISNSPALDPNTILTIYNNLGLMGLRETGKFMALMLIAQSIGVGYSIDYFLKRKDILFGFGVSLVIIPVIIIPLHLSTLKWALTPVQFPTSLIELAKENNQTNTRTIIFPWHRFQAYQFSNGKIIDQLGPSLFTEYIYNEMFEYNGILTYSPEKWQQDMARITTGDEIGNEMLPLLYEREIASVVIFKTNDFQKYIDWARKNNLSQTKDTPEFVAYSL